MDEKYLLSDEDEHQPVDISDEEFAVSGFDMPQGIGTTAGLFPLPMSRERRATYLSQQGREDEAFERDE